MQVTYSSLVVKNSQISGNFAKLGANVFSLIQSDILVENTTIDNSFNDMSIPEDNIVVRQEGMITLNQ